MLRWIPVMAGAIVLLAGAPILAADDKPVESAYYPLKVGTKWTYKVGDKEIVQSVSKHEKVGEVVCANVETEVAGAKASVEQIGVTEKGIGRYSFGTAKLESPVVLLKLPPAKGDTWKVDSKIGTEVLKGTFTNSGEEDITVPAGKYKAFKISGEFDVAGQNMTFVYYFAKDVGVVKQVITGAGLDLTSELQKYEAGK